MLGVAAVVLAADQATKAAVLASGPGARAAGELLRVELVRNRGAAFGLGPALTPLYAAAAVLAVAVCLYYGLRSRPAVLSATLGLIAGGAAGNLADRLARPPGPFHGAVIDWIKVAFYPPAFNLADVALRAGVAILVVRMLYQAYHVGPRVPPGSVPSAPHLTSPRAAPEEDLSSAAG
jgi:signal peptidase II